MYVCIYIYMCMIYMIWDALLLFNYICSNWSSWPKAKSSIHAPCQQRGAAPLRTLVRGQVPNAVDPFVDLAGSQVCKWRPWTGGVSPGNSSGVIQLFQVPGGSKTGSALHRPTQFDTCFFHIL